MLQRLGRTLAIEAHHLEEGIHVTKRLHPDFSRFKIGFEGAPVDGLFFHEACSFLRNRYDISIGPANSSKHGRGQNSRAIFGVADKYRADPEPELFSEHQGREKAERVIAAIILDRRENGAIVRDENAGIASREQRVVTGDRVVDKVPVTQLFNFSGQPADLRFGESPHRAGAHSLAVAVSEPALLLETNPLAVDGQRREGEKNVKAQESLPSCQLLSTP